MKATRNDLEVRLARTEAELQQAQALRYRVFYEEMGAVPDAQALRTRRDVDRFDEFADHMIVLDHSRARSPVTGCYRLLRESVAARSGGFYSSNEFDLSVLEGRSREMLELGRSCVDRDYRTGAVMQALWRGIATYYEQFDISVMIGCASLPGRDIAAVAQSIRYLHEHHLAPLHIRPHAHSHCRVAHEPFAAPDYDAARALRALPPLLRGYLRLGAMIGEGAVLDEQFNTIDVCIVLPTQLIVERYLRHYQMPARVTADA
jgi:putative hemolysin